MVGNHRCGQPGRRHQLHPACGDGDTELSMDSGATDGEVRTMTAAGPDELLAPTEQTWAPQRLRSVRMVVTKLGLVWQQLQWNHQLRRRHRCDMLLIDDLL
jgi:hypothetical protein